MKFGFIMHFIRVLQLLLVLADEGEMLLHSADQRIQQRRLPQNHRTKRNYNESPISSELQN